jgi:hypothetical protein
VRGSGAQGLGGARLSVGVGHDRVCEQGRRWRAPEEEATCGCGMGRGTSCDCGAAGLGCNELGAVATRRNGGDLGFHLDLIFGLKTWSRT